MTIKIYIADDHELVRDGMKSLMDDYPEIHIAGDSAGGRQAVKDVLALCPDVAVLDINMSDLNGIDAAQQILSQNTNTRIIILSMLGTPEHIYRALKAGVRGYILKESASRELIEAIRFVSAGKLYFSQPVIQTLVNDYLALRENNLTHSPLDSLSSREREILPLVVEGMSSSEIGLTLHLSRKTVETYRSRMMQKLGVEDMPGLLRLAMKEGLIS